MQLYEGIIKSWKVDKGFGFIQPNGGGKDVFIHIRDLQHSNYQPQHGDNIQYKIVADKDGKIRAYDAFIKGQEISNQYRKKSFKKNQQQEQKIKHEYEMLPRLIIAIMPFIGSVILIKESFNFIPFFAYLSLSLLTFIVYAYDKKKAYKHEWRVPEKTLHFLELFGGWPGALIAQQVIRHKNKKIFFQIVFWIIVFIHMVIWSDIIFFNGDGTKNISFLCDFYNICQ